MKRFHLVIFLFLIFAQCCLGASVIELPASTATRQEDVVIIEKKDLLRRVMQALPLDLDTVARNTCFSAAASILQDSYEVDVRPIISADGKNKFGHACPLDPEVLAEVMDLSQGKIVLEVAAAKGDNAFLIGLTGAEKVYINEIEPSEIEYCQAILNMLPPYTQSKFTILPGDCFEVFKSDNYTAFFDVIYARNIIHFFFGERREQFVRTMARLLKPGGHLIITANSARKFLEYPHISNISAQYVFMQRGYQIRFPEGSHKLFQRFSVEMDLAQVDPLRYTYIPVIRFTHNGLVYEEEFNALHQQDKTKLKKYAAQCVAQYGLDNLARTNRSIECYKNQNICYLPTTLEAACSSATALVATKTICTDLVGHITVVEKEESHITMFFKKTVA